MKKRRSSAVRNISAANSTENGKKFIGHFGRVAGGRSKTICQGEHNDKMGI